MIGQEKSLEDIADLITDAIFTDGIVKKADMRLKILALIKGFVKVQNSPSRAITDASPVKAGERAGYVNSLQQEKEEKQFWRNEVAKLVGMDRMKELYDKLDIEKLKGKFKPT
jgi:hypothetical protein